jgi:energy-coupling factor transport system permease protein
LARLDPRTKLMLGLIAIGAVFIAREPESLLSECLIILICVALLRPWKKLLGSFRLVWPMVGLVFVITLIFFDIRSALLLSVRLFNLLTVSFIFFSAITPNEMGDALKLIGMPYTFAFILTTSIRYVPLIGVKIRHIIDAQVSRGIDLRPRIKNVRNFMALLMPLLIQSFVLSDELAIAMESRGFGRKGRTSRRQYHMGLRDYGLMVLSVGFLVAFAWWERW